MLTIFGNLLAQPAALFHGNAFYPVGLSLTFAEPLLAPALVAGPLHLATGSPVLAYNVTLLLFWAASGWATYAVASWLTRDHAAALVAALVFTFAPYRTELYLEFQMEIAVGIPLAVYTLVRFLETQRLGPLVAFLAVFWLQAVSVWYYAVILVFGLAVVIVQYAALRWTGWRGRTLAAAAIGGGVLGLALAPVAWPFFVTRRELGFERGLDDVAERSADVLTYLEARPNRLYHVVPAGHYFETSLFPGAVALALAVVGLLWLRRDDRTDRGGAERWLAAGVAVAIALGVLALATRGRAHVGPFQTPLAFSGVGVALLALLVARQALEGWRRRRAGVTERRLGERGWVLVLLGLALLALLLSLGPVVNLAGRPIGVGLYAWLYPWLLPLRAIRAATRIGVLVLLAVALLAAFGVAWLRARLPRRAYAPLAGALVVLLGLEYATFPLPYERVASATRPVDAVLRAEAADGVVLEWPTHVADADADAMFRSIGHGKRIVNGYSGFVPGLLSELSGLLSEPGPPFPVPEARAALARIYPLRYLVVRLTDPGLAPQWRPAWRALREAPPPGFRFRGTFGDEDLYEIMPGPERGLQVERWVSYDFLRRHPVARLGVRPLASGPELEQWADVVLNGRPVRRIALDSAVTATVVLAPPFRRAAPNVVTLGYGYRRPPAARDARYRIGATAVLAPGDLRVRSGGQPHGDVASIVLDGVEQAPNRRGYNLVALDPAGAVRERVVFDTFYDPDAAARLAAFVAALPAGTIVAGAVKDEGSGRLSGAAVAALGTLGVAGDLRGRFRESHALVGVKGAAPGTALEALGPRAAELVVGRPEGGPGLELTAFELAAPDP